MSVDAQHTMTKKRRTPLSDVVTTRCEPMKGGGYAEHITVECPQPWRVLREPRPQQVRR